MRVKITTLIVCLCAVYLTAQESACNFHLVVLGSSTAAGSGPTSPDSAWVNIYREHVQNLNPNYKVTNLAIGGTTTYHIMPDDFVPPAGRANPNVDNNISEAVRLGATAIIVNMPSNDTSNGYSAADQLDNFATMAQFAADNNVPIWICTTQPKNYSNQNQIDDQIAVKDEILTTYGMFALDFWSEIATAGGTIKAEYDSGDGTHLNNAAHAIFAQRVIDKSLPDSALSSFDYQELVLNDLEITEASFCGGFFNFSGSLSNHGIEIMAGQTIDHYIDGDLISSTDIPMLGSCEDFVYDFNSFVSDLGNHEVSSILSNPDPVNTATDTSAIYFEISTPPTITVTHDTICDNRATQLEASATNANNIFWYSDLISDVPIGEGESYITTKLTNDTSFYVEAVAGEIFFRDQLQTSTNANKEWNGIMFDIIPKVDLIIDSLELKLKDIGIQTVNALYKDGSYLGFENDQTKWTSWGKDTVDVTAEASFHRVNLGALTLTAGNTYGIYLHLVQSDKRLMYNDLNEARTYDNDELSLTTGTGITHIFKQNYYPRDWNGKLFYHHGYKPNGDCKTERTEVTVTISHPTVDLGADTTIFIDQTLLIEAQAGFKQYAWNGKPGGKAITFDPEEENIGENIIVVQVRNNYNCIATDTMTVTVLYPDRDNDGYPSNEDCDDFNGFINPGAMEIPDNDVDENCDGILGYADNDMDGYNSQEDCDDFDANINPGATEIPNNGIDENCDGEDFVIDEDMDGYNSDEDCDDNNALINPGATEIPNNDVDEDCDGIAAIQDADMDGFNSDEDCDDFNSGVYPGATEIPNNGIDEDCNGQDLLLLDQDNDGFTDDVDCDDMDPNVNPDATEIANNDIDEDCDGILLIIDEDMDGYNSDEDCDETNAAINPGATEIPNNNVDEDCDGEALVIDIDMDGFNSDEDCDDNNAMINPDATEIPNNNIDEDCDGETLVIDDDMDGFNSDEDCDDNNAMINPDATEIPNNNVDEDCDGEALIIDVDMDGFNSDEDCDDNNAMINPDATEIPNNNIDEDCDGETLVIDDDMDGFNSDEDCDDSNAMINPDATEIPNNNIDEDCDGEALIIDDDMDGFNSDEDCDDNNDSIYPGAEEIANNGIDEDCNGSDWILSATNDNTVQKIVIYPNPTIDGIFYIEGIQDADQIRLFNLNGQELPIILQNNILKIERKGVFALSIRYANKWKTYKLVCI